MTERVTLNQLLVKIVRQEMSHRHGEELEASKLMVMARKEIDSLPEALRPTTKLTRQSVHKAIYKIRKGNKVAQQENKDVAFTQEEILAASALLRVCQDHDKAVRLLQVVGQVMEEK